MHALVHNLTIFLLITRDILHPLLVNPRLVADAVAPVAVLVPVAVIVDQTLQIVVVVVVSIL